MEYRLGRAFSESGLASRVSCLRPNPRKRKKPQKKKTSDFWDFFQFFVQRFVLRQRRSTRLQKKPSEYRELFKIKFSYFHIFTFFFWDFKKKQEKNIFFFKEMPIFSRKFQNKLCRMRSRRASQSDTLLQSQSINHTNYAIPSD